MKKLSLTIGILVIAACTLLAQAPQSFKYQAIARDVEGNIISNKQISLRINLLQGSKSGKVVYSEDHDLQTSDFGLILLEIGNGNNKRCDFTSIDWGNDNYFVSIEIDKNGGSDYVSMGISQLLSVPYALYAEESGSGSGSSSKEANSWTDGASVTYLTNSGWNVGIGTSDPSSKLDVIGKGTFENVYGSKTDVTTAGGHLVSNKFEVLYEPASSSAVKGSSLQIKAVTADHPANTHFTSFLQGLRFSLIHRNNGTVAQLIGGRFQMGMPTGAWGGSGTTGIINSMKGIDMELYGMKGTVNYGTGISLESIGSNFTNLTYLRINQPTDVAGNYGIYNNSSYDNYFAGNVGIGTTSPAGILDIAGAYHFPSNDGTIGQVLQTDGSGALNWSDDGGATGINDLVDGKTDTTSVFLGSDAGLNDDGTDNENVGVGINTLKMNTSGSQNTAIGRNSLLLNTVGYNNTAIGTYTLMNNTTGNDNTAVGTSALFYNTTGSANTANGRSALNSNTEGSNNTAIGFQTLKSNTTGSFNTASGRNALHYNLTGVSNSAYGYRTMFSNTTGSGNTAIGFQANYSNQEGSDNTIIGYEAGKGTSNHNKSGNVFLGYQAGYNDTTDSKLYIENSSSLSPLIYGEFDNDLVKINGSLEVTGTWTGMEIDDLNDGKTNATSVFLGLGAGAGNTGSFNTGVGVDALTSNTSGMRNTANGYHSLYKNADGIGNTALGEQTLYNNLSGEYNTATGVDVLYSNTDGSGNTANGAGTLYYNTNGNNNTAIGRDALQKNTTGDNNTALGVDALENNETGNNNTSIGIGANKYNQIGSNNTIIGYEAGRGTSNHNKSGNVFLGYQAGYSEITNSKLYIENSNSTTPLIYGEFDNDLLRINGTLDVNGSLGIGTTAPSEKMEIIGNVVADTMKAHAFSSTSPLLLQTDGITRIYVDDATGNVGIGTSAPSGILDIAGEYNFPNTDGANGQVLQTDGSGTLSWSNNSGVHYVGELFGGGIVFFVYDNGQHGLIASLDDLDGGSGAQWGFYHVDIPSCENMTDGSGNTDSIINAGGSSSDAAGLCDAYSAGGQNDWYLPSLKELSLLETQDILIDRKLSNDGDPNSKPFNQAYTSPTYGTYWSSTELSGDEVWYMSFTSGSATWGTKNALRRVRAIRAF